MRTDEVVDIPLAQDTEQERTAPLQPSEETLVRLRTDVYQRTLSNCVYNFFGVGFCYPFVAIPCACVADLLRYGLQTRSLAELLLSVIIYVFTAALTGVVLGVIATSVGGIVAISLVHLANRNFRFPLSVAASSAVVSSIMVFLIAVPYAVAGWSRTPEFWLIGVGLGTFFCQWTVLKTVRRELPKVIEVRANSAPIAPELLVRFLSKPTRWQFELRDILLATVWFAVFFAALRVLRLADIYLEMYVLLSFLFHVPMCWLMLCWYRASEQFGNGIP